jgi:hypothetical protein
VPEGVRDQVEEDALPGEVAVRAMPTVVNCPVL